MGGPYGAFDRLNGLLSWWGAPNTAAQGGVEERLKRFRAFAAELQHAFNEAQSDQLQALIASNANIVASMRKLAVCRAPQDVVAAELVIFATLLNDAATRADVSVRFLQKVRTCCAELLNDVGSDSREPGDARFDKRRSTKLRQDGKRKGSLAP